MTLYLSFSKIKDTTACIAFGYLFVMFVNKIVEYNSIPLYVGSIVENNTADDISEDTAAYIANELISEESRNRNSQDDLS